MVFRPLVVSRMVKNPTKLDMYEFTEIKECVTEWVWGARRSAGKSDNTRHV